MRVGWVVVALVWCVWASCAIVPLPPLDVEEQPGEIRYMTWNIRIDRLDSQVDDWPNRKAGMTAVIRDLQPDVIGLQEASSVDGFEMVEPYRPFSWLVAELTEYGVIAPEGPGFTSTTNPILYRKERLLPLEQGVFWLSDTPDVPDSTSWGNALPRFVTWAKFFDREGGTIFMVANSHLDADSGVSRTKSMELMRERLYTYWMPVVLGGDFNMSRNDPAFEPMLDICSFTDEDDDSSTDVLGLRIDHVLASTPWDIIDTWVCLPAYNPSDHRPVMARLVVDDST